jgi:hypothetical protein
MSLNTRLRRLLEFSTAILLLVFTAAALALRAPMRVTAAVDNPVVLNIRTLLFHCPACEQVRHCGTDCVTLDAAEARRRGGKPCLVCGGICLARNQAPLSAR